MSDVELRERVSAAVFDAAVKAASVPDKAGTPVLNLEIAQDGAIEALAMLIDADPKVTSGEEIVATCAFKAAQVTSQALNFRANFDATGKRQWMPRKIGRLRPH